MERAVAHHGFGVTADHSAPLRLWIAGPVQVAAGNYPVRVRELRPGRAIMEGWARPAVGSMALLTRGTLAIPCVVVASGGSSFEIVLRRPEDEIALLAATAMSTPGQRHMAPPFPFDPRYEDGWISDLQGDFATSRF
jgi:hypothetical protein